jgi:hypothetical protein
MEGGGFVVDCVPDLDIIYGVSWKGMRIEILLSLIYMYVTVDHPVMTSNPLCTKSFYGKLCNV